MTRHQRVTLPHAPLWDACETEMQKDVAASFGLKPGAFQMRLVRMRQKYQDLLKATVADTLTDPEDLDAELRFLQNAVRRL